MALTPRCQGFIVSAILAATLTGCGGVVPTVSATVVSTAAAGAAATPSPAATPTSAPTLILAPTVDLKASGDAYLAMSTKLATTLTPIFDELAFRSHNDAEYVKLNQDAATAYRTAIQELAAIEAPAEVQGDVSALSDVLDKLAKEFEHTVADTSYDNAPASEALNSKIRKSAAAIRKALGLPPPG